jgi:signal transduction histidine kinase
MVMRECGEHAMTAVAEATRTLAMLNAQADSLRDELAWLRGNLAEVHRDTGGMRAAELLEANEQLVMAVLQANAIAETAVSNLAELTRSSHRDTMAQEVPLAKEDLAQLDLREANEQLVIATLSAHELKGHSDDAHRRQITFLAMVAHELRNPLTPIRTAAELLNHARNDEPMLERLQVIIKRQVDHMSRLVEDLLDGSRVTIGKFRLDRGRMDLADTLNVAIETIRPEMDRRLQHLTVQLPPHPLIVDGDAVRLSQVFSNLLDNASKYTQDAGAIVLSAVAYDQSVEITIVDDGIGITAGALPHIFDLFVQDAHSLSRDNGGLGIGLAVVRDLVEAHGGTVVGRSDGRGAGSEFVVTLPLVKATPN